MSLFKKTNTELADKLALAQSDAGELLTQVDALQTAKESVEAELQTQTEQLTQLASAKDELTSQLAELASDNAKLDAQIVDLTKSQESFDDKVCLAVTAKLADLDTVEVIEDEEVEGGKDLMATFKSLEGQALAEFYEANKHNLYKG